LRIRAPRVRRTVTPAVAAAVVVLAGLLWLPNSVVVELGLIFLALKIVVSGRPHRWRGRTAELGVDRYRRVVVLVPMYNEDPDILLACLRSLIAQTRRPDRIQLIDDGSTSTDATRAVRALMERWPELIALSSHAHNLGKRQAIASGVRANPDATIFVTVDSDTVLASDAIQHLLAPFADRSVLGTTALVRVLNGRTNLLTRLIDLRYANAFLLDRGFQSRFGSVLCACGSLAAWRSTVLTSNLEDFTGQSFLGRACTYGDDRRLTNYALRDGRVLLVPEAVAWTAAPERLRHYVRQQLRWSRSFIRESLWAITHLPLRRPATWLALAEFTTWALFTFVLLTVAVTAPAAGLRLGLVTVAAYLVIASVMSWLRAVRWFDAGVEHESDSERMRTFLLAPMYALLHVFVLVPLRLVALCTLRSSGWGTRRGVEVRVDAATIRATVGSPGPAPHHGADQRVPSPRHPSPR
jgi:hyaluronan synthase